MPEPLVSIVMPCYNAAEHLEASVGSVMTQSMEDWELIVVDDGSSDQSAAWFDAVDDPRVILISQDNQGVTRSRNNGIARAKGEYLAFLDADDWWSADFLEQMLAALEQHPKCELAYCGWQNVGLPGKRGEDFVPPDYETPGKIEILLDGCRWPIHAALTRTAIVRECGGFDLRFQTSEDYGLWLKVACLNPIVRAPRVMAYYLFHQQQRSQNKVAAHQANKALNHRRLVSTFIHENPQVESRLTRAQIRRFTDGELLRRGYQAYWDRDLPSARKIFRAVMRSGYGGLRDWVYMLPSLLPQALHSALLQWRDA